MNSSSTGISDNKSTSISKKTTSMDSDEPFYEVFYAVDFVCFFFCRTSTFFTKQSQNVIRCC